MTSQTRSLFKLPLSTHVIHYSVVVIRLPSPIHCYVLSPHSYANKGPPLAYTSMCTKCGFFTSNDPSSWCPVTRFLFYLDKYHAHTSRTPRFVEFVFVLYCSTVVRYERRILPRTARATERVICLKPWQCEDILNVVMHLMNS